MDQLLIGLLPLAPPVLILVIFAVRCHRRARTARESPPDCCGCQGWLLGNSWLLERKDCLVHRDEVKE